MIRTQEVRPAGRLEPLDALRGIAAIIVVLVHLQWACGRDVFAMGRFAVNEIGFGATGVLLFFVISGFSLELTMPKHEATGRPLLSYVLSRFFRIAPLFYLMIFVTWGRDKAYGWHTPHDPATLAANFGFVFNLVPGMQEGLVWASWTIGIETIFYLAFPLLYRWPRWVGALVTFVPCVIWLTIFHPTIFGTFAWCFFLGFMPLFLIGMWTRQVFGFLAQRQTRWAPWLFACALVILLAIAVIPNASDNSLLRLPIGVAYAALVIGALLWRPAFLANRVTSLFGALSYAIYLLHFPVLIAMEPVYRRLFSHLPHALAYTLAIPLTLTVLTPLAAAVYYGFERPIDRWRATLLPRTASDRPWQAPTHPLIAWWDGLWVHHAQPTPEKLDLDEIDRKQR